MNKLIPPAYAEEDDSIGLQLGDERSDVTRALITLDANKDVPARAKNRRCRLVITHHPLIFDPLKRIVASDPIGRIVLNFAAHTIALFTAHTNFDSVVGGVNDVLAEKLGLRDARVLEPTTPGQFEATGRAPAKLVVFVPESHLKRVQKAIFAAGGGRIGEYEMCSWRVGGAGSFKPLPAANPAIGKRGKYEEVDEFRLEALVEESKIGTVIAAVKAAHPYEEPAYDVYPLETYQPEAGIGRIGHLKEKLTLRRFAAIAKRKLKADRVLLTGKPSRTVSSVAVCGGGGRSLIEAAVRDGADVFLTGEVSYHDRLKCNEIGLALIEAGHFETEAVALKRLRSILQKGIPEVTFILDSLCRNVSRYV
jgi:dinuclear metal center YbgI/SA1388 family protein